MRKRPNINLSNKKKKKKRIKKEDIGFEFWVFLTEEESVNQLVYDWVALIGLYI